MTTKIACEGPAEGVMTRGLVQTEISYIEMSKKLVTGLYNTPNRDITTRKFFINNDEVLSVGKYACIYIF